MKRTSILVFCACFALGAFAKAESAADPEKIKAAEALAEAAGIKNQTKAGFSAMRPVIEQQAASINLAPAEKEELIQIYKNWYEKDIDHKLIYDKIVSLYAESFTREELVGLTQFYNTPLGKKSLSELPKLMQVGMQIGSFEAKKKFPLLQEKLKPFFEKVSEKKSAESKKEIKPSSPGATSP